MSFPQVSSKAMRNILKCEQMNSIISTLLREKIDIRGFFQEHYCWADCNDEDVQKYKVSE